MEKQDDFVYKNILKGILFFFEITAMLTGKKFYCRALKGDSDYNICINSDLIVSCNCDDEYGLGKLGNLGKQNIREIFSEGKACFFRKSLAKGRLPILNCARCTDLRWVKKKFAESYITDYTVPRMGIMIENTVNCNLACLRCPRKLIHSQRGKMSMSLDDIRRVSSTVRENNINIIYYFNLGEPFHSDKINEELKIIRKDNPETRIITSTNGLLLDTKKKREAALLLDEVVFSIHGSTQKSLSRYQRRGNFEKSYFNMKSLVKIRKSRKRKKPEIVWKYVLFRWNEDEKMISNAIKLAENAGVDRIYFELTQSPISGIAFRHYLGRGYLDKISKREGKIYTIKINRGEK